MDPSSFGHKLPGCFVLLKKLPDEYLKGYIQMNTSNDSVPTNNRTGRHKEISPDRTKGNDPRNTSFVYLTTSNNRAERQKGITPEFSVRYGTDAYVWEFQRYLFKLQDKKERDIIFKELKEKGIKQDLLIRNKRGEDKINEELVNWIMKSQCSGLPLELNWNTLAEATKKLQAEMVEIRRVEKRNTKNDGGTCRNPRSTLNKLFRNVDFS